MPMAISNTDIALALEEIADLLEIDGASTFRVRTYRSGAVTVRMLAKPALDVALTTLPGIGAETAAKIIELAKTGTTERLQEMRAKWPSGVRALLAVQGLGPKRTKQLHDVLQVKSLEDLRRAVDAGALAKVPGLGAALQKSLKETLGHAMLPDGYRFPLAVAAPIAEELVTQVRAMAGVYRCEAAGSLRRGKATVGDLDIVSCAEEPWAVIQEFVKLPLVRTILGAGDTRGSVTLHNGLQVDLRVVDEESYGAALLYFTGSKKHSIELRSAAIKLGFKLNEYGVFDGAKRLAGDTEHSMYAALGMAYLAPQQRER